MKEIIGYETFSEIVPIKKGWSSDKKYFIRTNSGEKLLLRVTDISHYERKKLEFEKMKQIAALGLPMSQPLHFGMCNHRQSVYALFTWCEGNSAEERLSHLTDSEQYKLGLEAGKNLRLIHSIPVPEGKAEWHIHFNQKLDQKIEKYKTCKITFEGDDKIIRYIENNRSLLINRPQTFHHGDYHVGNMVISPEQELSIIDFNRFDFGDPWEEFNRIVWSAAASSYFATGQIHGYFSEEPPEKFFRLLTLYISSNLLSAISWSTQFGNKEIRTMKKQAQDILSWFNDMDDVIPRWYLKDDQI